MLWLIPLVSEQWCSSVSPFPIPKSLINQCPDLQSRFGASGGMSAYHQFHTPHLIQARKINSPYKGTLSSYGYVLLVIYFLVHVKNPPVLPNLQQMPPLRPITKVIPLLIKIIPLNALTGGYSSQRLQHVVLRWHRPGQAKMALWQYRYCCWIVSPWPTRIPYQKLNTLYLGWLISFDIILGTFPTIQV